MRGVSPVVATVLMIAIAIAAAVIAYSWITTFQQRQQQNVTSSAKFLTFRVDYAYCDGTGNLRVGITNTSTEDVNLAAMSPVITVMDTSNNIVAVSRNISSPSVIAAGGSAELATTDGICSSLSKGTEYIVKVDVGTATAMSEPTVLQ